MRLVGVFLFGATLDRGATFGSTFGMARAPSYPNLETRATARGLRYRARVQVLHARKRGPWRSTAAEAYDDVLVLQAQGGVVADAPVTIGEAVARRIADAKASGVEAVTIGLYESLGKRFSGFVWHPSTSLAAVTPDELVAYVRKAKELGRGVNTIIEKDLVFLSSLFDLAGIAPNPVKDARKKLGKSLRLVARRRAVFLPHEVPALLERIAERNQKHADVFALVAHTGIRAGELCRLGKEDLDLVKKVLHVGAPKDRANPRTIPLVDDVAAAAGRLHEAAEEMVVAGGMNFLRSIVRRWKDRLDEPRLTLRTLRHTFVTTLLLEGVAPATVMFLAGHKSLTTTMKYLHEIETRKPDAVEALAQAFARPAPKPKTTPGP